MEEKKVWEEFEITYAPRLLSWEAKTERLWQRKMVVQMERINSDHRNERKSTCMWFSLNVRGGRRLLVT